MRQSAHGTPYPEGKVVQGKYTNKSLSAPHNTKIKNINNKNKINLDTILANNGIKNFQNNILTLNKKKTGKVKTQECKISIGTLNVRSLKKLESLSALEQAFKNSKL